MAVNRDFFLKIKEKAKRYNDTLIEKSCEALLSLDIPFLNNDGVKRSQAQYEVFNQYPPIYLLKKIRDTQVFPNAISSHCIRNKESFALYVHLPFCKKKCTFCCYFSITEWSRKDIDNYVSYLEKEIALLLKKSNLKYRKVSSIYWGGGTPTVLEQSQIDRLMKVIRGNFSITPDAELIFEATPESIDAYKLECFMRNGFNRLSMGIQTFDDKLLKLHKRLYTGDEAVGFFALSRRIGFSHINIDLLFGLANQTFETWGRTLRIAGDLRPTNITTYPCVNSYLRTNIFRKLKNLLPPEEERLLMHTMAIEKFLSMGYIQITPYQSIVSWQFPYSQQEHKARNGEIHALGVTGHSFVNNFDYHNQSSLSRYKDLLDKNRLPIERGRSLNKKEQMIRFIVYGLQKTSGLNRKDGGVDKMAFRERFGVSIEDAFKEELAKLEKLSLILNSNDYIRLSYRGLLYPVETSTFFYLEKDKKRIASLNNHKI